ncbi:MAG: hypothetical protein WC729_03850 [Sphingomonas sp.]|jgi:uncharacterized protein (TIGR02588 family)|uniref:hypothetical protein n=1 Tax=Sphingomonas sp. TaxID=28214 RepID=UPI003565FFD0
MAATRKPETPPLEWIAAGVGAVLLLFLFVVIGREAINGEAAQLPQIDVAVTGVSPAASGFIVAFEARNRTDGTAAAVEIEGVLKAGGAEIETSSATIDYVPGKGKAAGGLFFHEDPRKAALEVRALGFQTP